MDFHWDDSLTTPSPLATTPPQLTVTLRAPEVVDAVNPLIAELRMQRTGIAAIREGGQEDRRRHPAPRGGRPHPPAARALAIMQSQRVLRRLEIAEEIQEAGRNILRLLTGVLTDTDDKVGEHIKRLVAICPDGEKLATLVKSAAEAIDRAGDRAPRARHGHDQGQGARSGQRPT